MIQAGDFRNGVTVEIDNNIYTIIEFLHVKPGKGAAFVRTKVRNIKTGAVLEKTFRPNEKFPKAHIEKKDMQYLYNDGEMYHFMDVESYEQMALTEAQLDGALKFVRENDTVKMLSHKGVVFGIEPANFVELEVIATEPGVRGDTATNVNKPATVETGAVVHVPIFVNIGDKIKIDTRTEEYLGRA